jgi:hypothetical protein
MGGRSPASAAWGMGGNKGWTSDSRWGCKLRTSQSLLATAFGAIVHLFLFFFFHFVSFRLISILSPRSFCLSPILLFVFLSLRTRV